MPYQRTLGTLLRLWHRLFHGLVGGHAQSICVAALRSTWLECNILTFVTIQRSAVRIKRRGEDN